MKFHVRHAIAYRYDRPVSLGHQRLLLRPRPTVRPWISNYRLDMMPPARWHVWNLDRWGNFFCRAAVAKTAELALEVEFDVVDSQPARELPPVLADANDRVHDAITYVSRTAGDVQEPQETTQTGRGSCADIAWLLANELRASGVKAHFVSGYLLGTDPVSADLHAWVDAYVPGAGWFGLDPTLGRAAGGRHVPLASAVHYVDTVPVSGAVSAGVDAEVSWELTATRLSDKMTTLLPV